MGFAQIAGGPEKGPTPKLQFSLGTMIEFWSTVRTARTEKFIHQHWGSGASPSVIKQTIVPQYAVSPSDTNVVNPMATRVSI
jgi:hypothetical protein